MNNDYLHELIQEVQRRDGGIMLHIGGKTEAVVLSVERYNQLLLAKSTPLVKTQSVLVTGGAGYVGSYVVRQLLAAGHSVTVFDNLSTGSRENVPEGVVVEEGDTRDIHRLLDVLQRHQIEVVYHLAGSPDMGDQGDIHDTLHNDVVGTTVLLQAMAACNVKTIIFSSSAAVYGLTSGTPIPETFPLKPHTTYGQSKAIAEELINYYCQHAGFQAVIFRYYHACGMDNTRIASKYISHPLAEVRETLQGRQDAVSIYGKDFDTFDGTAVFDYVHVVDVARAHVVALDSLSRRPAFSVYNIGSAQGWSVGSIVQVAAELTGKMIPLEIKPARSSDLPISVVDGSRLRAELEFELQFTDLKTMILASIT